MADYTYAYLAWVGIFAVLWLLVYALRRDWRRNMLLTSLIAAPSGPIAEFFHSRDYWHPITITGTYPGIEDLLLGFFFGGLAAAAYLSMVRLLRQDLVARARAGVWRYVLITYVLGVIVLIVGVYGLGVPSLQAGMALLFAFGVGTLVYRPRMLPSVLLTTVVFGVFLLLFYQGYLYLYPGIVDAWWFGVSGARLWGVPVEEVVYGLMWGLVAGPMTELAARLRVPAWLPLEKLGIPR